jgi:hypothetical protein
MLLGVLLSYLTPVAECDGVLPESTCPQDFKRWHGYEVDTLQNIHEARAVCSFVLQ